MEAKVSWHGKMSFTGVANSGFALDLGTDPAVGGDNNGARPMEMIAIGWAGCTAMDVISILTKKRQQITAFEVQTHLTRAEEHPKVFTGAVFDYLVTGKNVDTCHCAPRHRTIVGTRYCPANAMLGKLVPAEFRYSIYEDLGSEPPRLVSSGVYTPTIEQISG